MRYRSKRYQKDVAAASEDKFPLNEAVGKLKGWASTKFDQTVECVVLLGIDAKQADQAVRGAISLPHGIGKTMRVIAFCDGEEINHAKAAGAIEAGADDLVKRVNDGWLEFDVAIAHPRMMGKVGKLGRVLGPQGKMPSPKSGTVTADIAQAVKDYAAGKVEYRNDTGGNVQVPVGKLSFDAQKLIENIETMLDRIRRAKPTSTKGTYIRKIFLTATMSPSVELLLS